MSTAYCITWLSGLCLAAPPLAKEETTALPVVVLIGDSIRMGYAPVVAEKLKGVAEVVSAAENGGDSGNVLKNLDAWAIAPKPAVIHFNAGLHDLKADKKTGAHQVELDAYRNGKEQMGLWYWGPDFPDPSNYLAFAPGGLIGKRANWPATAAPEINTVATQAGATADTAQRDALYQQFQQGLNASGPFIPLVQPPSNVVTATSVTGATYNPIWTVDVGTIGAK